MGRGIGSNHVIGFTESRQPWAWGINSSTSPCVGDDTNTNRSSPVLVVGSHSFVELAAGNYFSLARKSNGEGWAWGSNGGQLGDDTDTNRSSPVKVVGSHSFIRIGACSGTGYGLKNDTGIIWSWGGNNSGELGDNTIVTRSSPVPVVGSHSFIKVGTGFGSFNLALKSDGIAWGWGGNGTGQLGDNTSTNSKSSPVSVVGSHSFSEIFAGSLGGNALKSNGEEWCWGANASGQLGDNTVISKSSPVLVLGSHSFINGCSGSDFALSLKSNGEAWAWGNNAYGEIGDNTVTHRSSPVRVIGNHFFCEIGCGFEFSFGRKPNGELWSWGRNTAGQLGTNNAASYSSPVLVVGNLSLRFTRESDVAWETYTTAVTKNWRYIQVRVTYF